VILYSPMYAIFATVSMTFMPGDLVHLVPYLLLLGNAQLLQLSCQVFGCHVFSLEEAGG